MTIHARALLAFACAEAGRPEEAGEVTSRMLEMAPGYSVTFLDRTMPYRRDKQRDRFQAALRNAGLLERRGVANAFSLWLTSQAGSD